jgi:hypothetical protein
VITALGRYRAPLTLNPPPKVVRRSRRWPINYSAVPYPPHHKILEGTTQDLFRAANSNVAAIRYRFVTRPYHINARLHLA